jgi:hypothetical protein
MTLSVRLATATDAVILDNVVSFIGSSSSLAASGPCPSRGYAGSFPSWPVLPQGESGMRACALSPSTACPGGLVGGKAVQAATCGYDPISQFEPATLVLKRKTRLARQAPSGS